MVIRVRNNYIVIALLFTFTTVFSQELDTVAVANWGDVSSLIAEAEVNDTIVYGYNSIPLYRYPRVKDSGQAYGPLSLFFSPLVNMSFGNFKDPLKLKTGIVSHLELSLWKGALFDIRYAFPFYNEIDSSLAPYPRLAVLRHIFYRERMGYITLSSGIFTNNRWGIDLAWTRLSPQKVFQFSADMGYTGYSKFEDSTFNYSRLNKITGRITLSWFQEFFRMKSSLSLGRFLEKDWGGVVEVRRGFKLADIYLYFSVTSLGHNGGAGFVVPLWKRRYPNLTGLKIGPYRYFDWRYRYRSAEPPGNYYTTGNELDYYLWKLHPSMLRRNKSVSE